jgi:hypothetical protein
MVILHTSDPAAALRLAQTQGYRTPNSRKCSFLNILRIFGTRMRIFILFICHQDGVQ